MPVQSPKRGATPSPRSALAAATPHVPSIGAPLNFIVLPQRISMWGNDVHGDCVTAEEAFAKACHNPEVFIPDADVIAWASRHGVLEGANLTQVLTWMQTDGFAEGAVVYDDGPYFSVDWTNAATLQSAIYQGPVKIGIAADQIDAAWLSTGGRTGWFATGFHTDKNEDHCVSLCGYGTISWLAQQLHVPVPAGIDGTKPGYALFTWNSIGIIDVPSLIAITEEAWLRRPTTVTIPTISVFQATSPVAAHPTVSVGVPQGYKLVGGGALDHSVEPGNMLTASYPSSATQWTVAGKDHIQSAPSAITAYALGLHDPNNEWETTIVAAQSGRVAHPAAAAAVPVGFVMTGGGARVEYSGAGNILTASYPSSTSTWQVASKDHEVSDPATVTAYAIGLRRRDGRPVQRTVAVATGSVAAHPQASVSLPTGWELTGGGAIDHYSEPGNMLTASYPQGQTWQAAGKDHLVSSPANISVYAIGIRLV